MEHLELVLLTDEKVTYRYYPEGGEAFGVVSLMRKTGKRIHDVPCPGISSSLYARQAWYHIGQYQKAGEFPKRGQAAWC